MNGILNFYKPEGMTSFQAVRICRRFFGTKKVGHAGTLDPLATGVLPVLIGNATKAASLFLAEQKTYHASFVTGFETDTEDITGEEISRTSFHASFEELELSAKSFLGTSLQVPPMYSALKKDGRPLYELARKGEEVEREAREITVYEILLVKGQEEHTFSLTVTCSKGTYIRTLVCDIARRAGTLATMTSLCRTSHGAFDLDGAVRVETLEELEKEGADLSKLLLPVEQAFDGLKDVHLPAFYSRLAHAGAEIYPGRARVGKEVLLGERVKLYDEKGQFFALGEKRTFEEGEAIKPIKLFL